MVAWGGAYSHDTGIMSNDKIVNLSDHRKPQELAVPEALEGLFPDFLRESMAKTMQATRDAAIEYQHLTRLVDAFKPSTVPALENPALVPFFKLRFQGASLRELFVPLRSRLHTAQYEGLYTRFGLYFDVGSMTGNAPHFDIWVQFGEVSTRTNRIKSAYSKAKLDWIDAIVGSAVELRLGEKAPSALSGLHDARALIRIPRIPE